MPSDPKPADLAKLKRDELDEAATKAGVPDPEALPNKEAVIDAIEGPNPALAPVTAVEEPRERKYVVVGTSLVYGHARGETFKATIAAPQEALLIESGHIKRTNPQED